MIVGWFGVLLLLLVSTFGVVFLAGIGERRAAAVVCVPGLVLALVGVAALIALTPADSLTG